MEIYVELVTQDIEYGCLSDLSDWPQCSNDVVRQAGIKDGQRWQECKAESERGGLFPERNIDLIISFSLARSSSVLSEEDGE